MENKSNNEMKDVVMSYNYISGINQVKRIGKVAEIDKERYHNLMKNDEDVLNYEKDGSEYHLLKVGDDLAKLEVGKSGSFISTFLAVFGNSVFTNSLKSSFILSKEKFSLICLACL